MYKALIDIGDFKAGDEVPSELAIVWSEMYKVSPVEEVGEGSKVEPAKPVEPAKVEPVVPAKPVAPAVASWIDDYLSRNSSVVISNLTKDSHSKKDMKDMLEYEQKNKKRSEVISLLNKKIKG